VNFDLARAAGGRLLLRIEDIDATRCRREFEAAIYEDLAWLGITFDADVRRQSEHFGDYREALTRLDALGLLYPAFESRAEIAALVAAQSATWPRDPDGAPIYPGTAGALPGAERARRIAAGEPYALRLDMRTALARVDAASLSFTETGSKPDRESVAAEPARWGDVVLGRKEMPTSYHLAVVVDDARQGVTHAVRGRDLLPATGLHRLLQALLGLPAPVYHHHRLVLDTYGRKLSKSTAATALRTLRRDGVTAADIRRIVGLH
jgi:glutamyl-Q tRNA(Asp) synthetase